MGMEYWPIIGYGVHVVPEMIDAEKAARFLGVEEFDPERDLADLLDAVCAASGGRLRWEENASFWEDPTYYLCTDNCRRAAQEAELEELVARLLGPVLRGGVDPADLEVAPIFSVAGREDKP
ncbi:MAG: hypothetical protein ACPLRW_05560 [Moorellales bacterium]